MFLAAENEPRISRISRMGKRSRPTTGSIWPVRKTRKNRNRKEPGSAKLSFEPLEVGFAQPREDDDDEDVDQPAEHQR
jgi:hypothetical protein